MPESKFWVFTLNNPTEDEEQDVTDFLSGRHVVYGVFGRETGESGTPHFQGFVVLGRSRRLSYLRAKISPRGHYEIARGTPAQAADYCKKDGDFEEFGTFPASRQGKRTDLDDVIEWIDNFIEDNGRAPGSPEIAKFQPRAYIKYPRLVAMAEHRGPRRQLQFGEPNDWQRGLEQRLRGDADDRSIEFIVDVDGGKGKTWFCRWMVTNVESCQVLGTGKKDDMAHMLDTRKTIFLFNVARGQMEYLSYPLLESLKDRMVLSGKYNSSMKTWEKNVHVVVLGNEEPDYDKLTEDRYVVTHI